jgi:hypothetical protein
VSARDGGGYPSIGGEVVSSQRPIGRVVDDYRNVLCCMDEVSGNGDTSGVDRAVMVMVIRNHVLGHPNGWPHNEGCLRCAQRLRENLNAYLEEVGATA